MIWSFALSYVQIRVFVTLSLGFRFSLAGPRSLGVALEVGCLVFLYPTVIPLPVVRGLCPGFFLPSVWRTSTNQFWSAISILLLLAIVGPRAFYSLGVAFFTDPCGVYYILLQFGSVSLSLDLGCEFRPLLFWLSIFGLGFPVSLGMLLGWPVHFSKSLSL